MRSFHLLLAVLLSILPASECLSNNAVNNQSANVKHHTEQIKMAEWEISPVSIVNVNDHKFILCDYARLFSFDDKTNQLIQLIPKGYSGKLNPAGLFYDKEHNRLYVANYTEKNILIFEYDSNNNSLVLKTEIRNDFFKGPEGVFVIGNQLLIADYDGNLIFNYDIQVEPRMLWKSEVKQAHSIIKLGEDIFATSLTDSKIYKVDKNGKIVGSTAGVGNSAPQHLWPTHLFITHEGALGVVDPHQGSVSMYDSNLNLKSTFGKNGPAPDYNFPYTVNVTKTGYVMANTFRRQILFFSKDFNELKQVTFSSSDYRDIPSDETKYLNTHLPPRVYAYQDDSKQLLESIGMNTFLEAGKVYPGYNGLSIIQNDTLTKLIRLDSPKSVSYHDGGNFYITLVSKITYKNEDFYIIHSPQNDRVYIIDPKTSAAIKMDLTSDLWGHQIKKIFERKNHTDTLDKFFKLRELLSEGMPRAQAYETIFLKDKSEDDKEEFWKRNLSDSVLSENLAKKLLKGYSHADIQDYFEKILKEKEIFINEILFISYLTGNSIQDLIPKLTLYSNLSFYQGHGLEAGVNYADESSYVAAIENQKEQALTIRGELGTGSLILDWMPEAMPDHVLCNVYDRAGKLIDVLHSDDPKKFDLLDPRFETADSIKLSLMNTSSVKRLLLKKVMFIKQPTNELKSLNQQIYSSHKYDFDNTSGKVASLKEFKAGAPGHCGHFTAALSEILETQGYKTIAYDLKNKAGTVHTVLEVFNDKGVFLATLDPSTGTYYSVGVKYFVENAGKRIQPGLMLISERTNERLANYYLPAMATEQLTIIRIYNGFKELKAKSGL